MILQMTFRSESSKFQGTKVPWNESSAKQKFHEEKVPGSELAGQQKVV